MTNHLRGFRKNSGLVGLFRVFFFILFIGQLLPAHAQSADSRLRYPDRPPTLIAKFSPISLLDPVNPALQFAVEAKVAGPLYAQFEGGYIWGFSDDGEQNRWGYRLRGEARIYYLPVKRSTINPFAGFSFTYRQKRELNRNEQLLDLGNFFQFQEVEFNHRIHDRSFILLTGFQLMADNRFSFEFSIGAGYKWVQSRFEVSDPSINPESIFVENSNFFEPAWEDRPGNFFNWDVLLGLKVGYIIF